MKYVPKSQQAKTKPAAKKSSAKKGISLGEMSVNESASVRKIENGFIVSESGYTGTGKNRQWFNKDYFSPTNPLDAVKIKFGGKK